MKKILILGSLLGLCLHSGAVRADEGKGEAVKNVTLTGEVLDLTCYVENGSRGEKHAVCAKGCLTGGLPVGFLEDKTGNVFLVISKDHKSANAVLADKAGKTVKITGQVKASKGVNVLVMDKVE